MLRGRNSWPRAPSDMLASQIGTTPAEEVSRLFQEFLYKHTGLKKIKSDAVGPHGGEHPCVSQAGHVHYTLQALDGRITPQFGEDTNAILNLALSGFPGNCATVVISSLGTYRDFEEDYDVALMTACLKAIFDLAWYFNYTCVTSTHVANSPFFKQLLKPNMTSIYSARNIRTGNMVHTLVANTTKAQDPVVLPKSVKVRKVFNHYV